MITFSVHGDEQLRVNLVKLKVAVQRKITRKAVTAAMRPLRMTAKKFAPKDTGQMRKQLVSKIKTYKSGNVFGIVGVKNEKDSATGRRPSKYLHLVMGGTKAHDILPTKKRILVSTNLFAKGNKIKRIVFGRRVQHPGAKKNPFLTDAFHGSSEAALDKFRDVMRDGILDEVDKLP